MKNKVIIAVKVFVIVLALTLINCGLLAISFCLPTGPMRQHVAESYPLIESEHQYLQWDQGYTSSMMDFWSEYTLYGAAINEDAEGSAFERAMLMWYIDTPGVDKDKAVETYARYPEEHFELTAYPRYWNGVVIFMKIMLLFFTIPDIRMINMFIQLALLAVVIFLMAQKNMVVELVALLTAIFFINPITMIYSLVYATEYVPMLLSIIAILLFGEKIENTEGGWALFFAIVGSVTSFFCFLSSPFITLGIPLVIMLWCTSRRKIVGNVIINSCYWAVAYGLTWGMKWVICTLFTSYDLIKNVFDRVDVYENLENTENSGTTLVERFMRNLWVYKTPAFMLLFIAAIILLAVALAMTKRSIGSIDETNIGNKTKKNLIDEILGYILIACIPITVVIILGNGYSYNHYFMSHRNFAITVLASLCIIKRLFSWIIEKRNAIGCRNRV